MKTLSLIDRDFDKGLWIAQMSFIFTRCGGYYRGEQDGEIEASFKFAAASELILFFRDIPSSDLSLFYNVITRNKFGFIDDLLYNLSKPVRILDLSPGIGLACIFAKCRFPNSEIYAFNQDIIDHNQMVKNFLANGIINQLNRNIAVSRESAREPANSTLDYFANFSELADVLIINASQFAFIIDECIDYKEKLASIDTIIIDNSSNENKVSVFDILPWLDEIGFLNFQKSDYLVLYKSGIFAC
jgi:hypothetical protein